MTAVTEPIPLYSTSNTSLAQCDQNEKFLITLFDQEIELSVCSLIAFKKKIKDLDIPSLFADEHPGIEIIELPHCDRFFAFTIREILELKDLFAGSFVMLELNSLIHKALVRRF